MVLFLDVSKAVYTVNRSLLFSNLKHLEISDSRLSWFHPYISNWTQITSVSSVHSSVAFPMFRALQEFILGLARLYMEAEQRR